MICKHLEICADELISEESLNPSTHPCIQLEARFTKSVPAKLKMMVKGGAAVDPDSG